MSYHDSGKLVVASSLFDTDYTYPDGVVRFIKKTLKDAGWTVASNLQSVTQITFHTLVIFGGVIFTIKGFTYGFYTPPHDPPPVNVPIIIDDGDTTFILLSKLANEIQSHQPPILAEVDLATNSIKLSNFPPNSLDDTSNNIICSVFPTGNVGLWDNSIGSGSGATWHGGYTMVSQSTGGLQLRLKFYTINGNGDISIGDEGDVSSFNGGLFSGNSWTLVASPYQGVLYRPGFTGAGNLFIFSNMYPDDLLSYFHFICGPTHSNVGPEGGNRNDFTTFLRHYYVNSSITSTPYIASGGTGSVFQEPVLCTPGYSRGIAPIDHIPNVIGHFHLPLLNDLGVGFPFESFLAVCPDKPAVGQTLKILGSFWDSLVYSVYTLPDESAIIDNHGGAVILSQDGTSDNTIGSFVFRTEPTSPPL